MSHRGRGENEKAKADRAACAGGSGDRGSRRNGSVRRRQRRGFQDVAAVDAEVVPSCGRNIVPILTVGDTLPGGYRFEAIPDGISIRREATDEPTCSSTRDLDRRFPIRDGRADRG